MISLARDEIINIMLSYDAEVECVGFVREGVVLLVISLYNVLEIWHDVIYLIKTAIKKNEFRNTFAEESFKVWENLGMMADISMITRSDVTTVKEKFGGLDMERGVMKYLELLMSFNEGLRSKRMIEDRRRKIKQKMIWILFS